MINGPAESMIGGLISIFDRRSSDHFDLYQTSANAGRMVVSRAERVAATAVWQSVERGHITPWLETPAKSGKRRLADHGRQGCHALVALTYEKIRFLRAPQQHRP